MGMLERRVKKYAISKKEVDVDFFKDYVDYGHSHQLEFPDEKSMIRWSIVTKESCDLVDPDDEGRISSDELERTLRNRLHIIHRSTREDWDEVNSKRQFRNKKRSPLNEVIRLINL